MVLVGFMFLLTMASSTACKTPNKENANNNKGPEAIITTQQGRRIPVEIELATTSAQQAKGLMFRAHLEENRGMLFIFEDDQIRTFWMKNTLIPLDMIFIDKEFQVVGVVHEATPRTTSPRMVPYASRFVLEINGGLAKKWGIRRGDRVTLANLPFSLSR